MVSSFRQRTSITTKSKDSLQFATAPTVIFVCWTPGGIHIEHIARRDEVFLDIKPKLDKYFIHIILPCILSGRMDQENEPPPSAHPTLC